MSRDWAYGLFGCFSAGSDCCVGWCCPCILYGKANFRLKNAGDVSMQGYSTCNTPCSLFCLGLYFTAGIGSCILQTLQRGEVRHALDLKGGAAGDCCVSFCCHCCSLIQNEHELEDWQEKKNAYAVVAVAVQPGMQQPMQYGQA